MTSSKRAILSIDADPVFVRPLRPGRPTLLLLHGLDDSSLAFDEAFSRNGVVAPDLPRHGCSPAARDGRYTVEALASRLVALIEAMDLRRLAAVGHSLSSDIAAVLASRDHSGRIDRVANVDGLSHCGMVRPRALTFRSRFELYPRIRRPC